MGVEFVRYAVVTGANKGIGLEIVRQLASAGIKVVLTARNEERGIQALQTLKDSGLSHLVLFHQVDVADATSVASLADFIKSKFGKLDILVTCNFDSPLLFLDCLVVNESLSKQSYKSACNYFSVFMILNINFCLVVVLSFFALFLCCKVPQFAPLLSFVLVDLCVI